MGIVYRTWQFWQALLASPSANDLELVHSILSPEQVHLFELMDQKDQVHSLQVLHRLLDKQNNYPDLLTAALLHDVGKIKYPLRLWERVWLVLGNPFIPKLITNWHQVSESDISGVKAWQRPFLVADRHAGWSAELACKAGVSTLCVNLINRHHEKLKKHPGSTEEQLLWLLQEADNLS